MAVGPEDATHVRHSASCALCDAPIGRGGTWNREGVILFGPTVNTPIHRISVSGGAATPITAIDLSKNETTHRWPYFLPDGRHFLYVAGTPFAPKENPTNAIMAGSLDSRESKLLFYTHSNAIYASGHILFLRQNTLMAQPFDPKRLELTGDAFPIADPVQEDEATLRRRSRTTSQLRFDGVVPLGQGFMALQSQ